MEMIVVLVIIGLLISGGIGFYNGFIENSKVIKAKSQISVMQGAVDSWYAEHGLYPTNLDDQMLAGLDTEAKDPWGKEYLIVVTSEGGTDNCYVIRTGYEQIHQNIHEHYLRLMLLNHLHSFTSVFCLTDNFNGRISIQKCSNQRPQLSIVISNDDTRQLNPLPHLKIAFVTGKHYLPQFPDFGLSFHPLLV
jgi:general secretion pathway protein G